MEENGISGRILPAQVPLLCIWWYAMKTTTGTMHGTSVLPWTWRRGGPTTGPTSSIRSCLNANWPDTRSTPTPRWASSSAHPLFGGHPTGVPGGEGWQQEVDGERAVVADQHLDAVLRPEQEKRYKISVPPKIKKEILTSFINFFVTFCYIMFCILCIINIIDNSCSAS